MKKKLVVFACLLSTMSTTSIAGSKIVAPVTVDVGSDGSGAARGSLSSARGLLNAYAAIGCRVDAVRLDTGVDRIGTCTATDGENQTLECVTKDPVLIETMMALNDFSYLDFRRDVEGQCSQVTVSVESAFLPEVEM